MQTKQFNESIDLSQIESWRRYRFANKTCEINRPTTLVVRDDGSHIITDGQGAVHHIEGDWLAFEAKGRFEINVLPEGKIAEGGQWHILHTPRRFQYGYKAAAIELAFDGVHQYYQKGSGSHKLVMNRERIAYVRPLWDTFSKAVLVENQ